MKGFQDSTIHVRYIRSYDVYVKKVQPRTNKTSFDQTFDKKYLEEFCEHTEGSMKLRIIAKFVKLKDDDCTFVKFQDSFLDCAIYLTI